MKYLLKKFFIIFIGLYITLLIIPSFKIGNGWMDLLYASLILSLMSYIVRPIINLLILPLNIITFNFASWIVNIVLIFLWSLILPSVFFQKWDFPGIEISYIKLSPAVFLPWQTFLISAIILVLITRFIEWLIK